jgi:hypothetical protein
MKLNFAVICDNAFVDDSSRLNIIQIFDTIRAHSFPAVHPRLTIATSFALQESDDKTSSHTLNTTIKRISDGKEIATTTNSVSPNEKTKNLQFISYFVGLPIDGEGEYEIILEIGRRKESLTLRAERV